MMSIESDQERLSQAHNLASIRRELKATDLSSFSSYQGFRSASRLRGRKLIKPLPKSKSGFGDFAVERKQYAEFIVDIDENGDEVHRTCDPYKLDDHLGENSDTASKYTIVHFRKQVLDKMLHFPPNYFFSKRESQPRNTQETHVPTGLSTENPHRNADLKML